MYAALAEPARLLIVDILGAAASGVRRRPGLVVRSVGSAWRAIIRHIDSTIVAAHLGRAA